MNVFCNKIVKLLNLFPRLSINLIKKRNWFHSRLLKSPGVTLHKIWKSTNFKIYKQNKMSCLIKTKSIEPNTALWIHSLWLRVSLTRFKVFKTTNCLQTQKWMFFRWLQMLVLAYARVSNHLQLTRIPRKINWTNWMTIHWSLNPFLNCQEAKLMINCIRLIINRYWTKVMCHNSKLEWLITNLTKRQIYVRIIYL